ncbi:tRNA-5-carboxymethylaminomethyl-2-thiouridine(34)synthesis protein MnmE, partial [hydrothermal vent metagenome]
VEIEAIVNFPEDDTEAYAEVQKTIGEHIQKAEQCIKELLNSSEHGKILKDGIKIVLCGKPNVGKSSLLNMLLKTSRAIVSDVAGTTRDTIEETAQIKGIPFQLIDTAGILEPRDSLEVEAVKRSQLSIKSADLILLVLDSSSALSEEDHKVIDHIQGKNILIVMNKCDLEKAVDEVQVRSLLPKKDIIKFSVLQKIGLQALEEMIVEKVWHGKNVDTHGVLISNLRHINALKEASQSLIKACQVLQEGISLEFVSEEVKIAVNFLDSITGRNVDADLLDTIFSKFCIGK